MTTVPLGVDDAGSEVIIDLPGLLAGRLLVMASSGGGKTWLLRRLLEQSFHLIQHAVIDPEGDLSTLAERYSYTVVDAARFDDMGEVALRVREHRLSVIVDISDLDREDQAGAVTEFLSGLVAAPRAHWHPMLVAIDEAHLFAPWGDAELSNATRKASVGAMTQLMSRGRKRGLAGVIATQRLAKLAKSVVSEVGNVLLGRCLLDIDTYRAADLLGWSRKRADELRKLETGQFLAFGEALTPHPMRVRIGRVGTRHAGATPALVPPPAVTPEEALQLLEGPDLTPKACEPEEGGAGPASGPGDGNSVARAMGLLSPRHVIVPVRGKFLMNGTTVLSAADLVARANRMLKRRGLPPIEEDLAAPEEDGEDDSPQEAAELPARRVRKRRATPRRDDSWSDDELVTLMVGYADNLDPKEMCRRLPGRTDSAIKGMAWALELRRPKVWTDERVAKLREVYADRELTLEEMADRVGVSVDAMRSKADALELERPDAWSDRQVADLRQASADGKFLKDDELLSRLGHSYRSAVSKAARLGIKFSKPAGSAGAREVARRRNAGAGPLPARDQILAALSKAPMRPKAIWDTIGRKASAQLHYMHASGEVQTVEIDGRTHYRLLQEAGAADAPTVSDVGSEDVQDGGEGVDEAPATRPRRGRRPNGSTAGRRFESHFAANPEAVVSLPADHPAAVEGRTLFPSTVAEPLDVARVLVSGLQSRKLGSRVVKGAWSGMALYQLSLEERKTCPRSCHHWLDCYGDAMPFARRHIHGPALEMALEQELGMLQRQHRDGFVVRLHVLGDFYSAEYVKRWATWLDEFPALRVFGYTAWPPGTEIGDAVNELATAQWDRFAIRLSAPEAGPRRAVTLRRRPGADDRLPGILCPVQSDKTDCCGTCGLCWSQGAKDRCIMFIRHGRTPKGSKGEAAPEGRTTAGQVPAEPTRPVPAEATPVERTVRAMLEAGEGLNGATLASRMGCSQGTASRHLRDLEAAGVVLRQGKGAHTHFVLSGAAPGATSPQLPAPELPTEDDGGEVPSRYPNSIVYSRGQYIAVYRGYRADTPASEIARSAGLTAGQVQICITGLIRCGALQRKSWAENERIDTRPPSREPDPRDALAIPAMPQPAVSEALVKGQRRLWRKVIVQALFDAVGRIQMIDVTASEARRQVLTDQARAWFVDGGRDFREVCGLAAWEPEWVQRKALALFEFVEALEPASREAFVRNFGNIEGEQVRTAKRRPPAVHQPHAAKFGPPKMQFAPAAFAVSRHQEAAHA